MRDMFGFQLVLDLRTKIEIKSETLDRADLRLTL